MLLYLGISQSTCIYNIFRRKLFLRRRSIEITYLHTRRFLDKEPRVSKTIESIKIVVVYMTLASVTRLHCFVTLYEDQGCRAGYTMHSYDGNNPA